jgi:hypothetical protein
MRLVINNDSGRYNPSDDQNSLWYGYLTQQRSLIKIHAGFVHATLGSDLIWDRTEYPQGAVWDQSSWEQDQWDQQGAVFTGIISGEVILNDANEVTIQAKPLTQLFKDYPARAITGYSASLTASGFMELLRDQTDVSGTYVFRPFLGDTTTNWSIQGTSNVYPDLSTATAKDIRDKTVWDVVEKLAEAENFSAYINQQGKFFFGPKDPPTDVTYQFHGVGSFDTTYGHTIKSIQRYGKDTSRYYSGVQIRYREEDTSTSYVVEESALEVLPNNTAWSWGYRLFQIDNYWMSTATAQAVASELKEELSALKDVLEFTTTFIPHLNLLDRVSVHYDSTTRPVAESLWDANDWDTELTWDASEGNAIILQGQEFKFVSIDINLDAFECKYVARAI